MQEQWRNLPQYPGYQVSNLGRVRSFKQNPNGHILKPGLSRGYRQVIVGKTRRVACLVALAFIGPRPPGLDVAHENGDKTDDRAVNLSYKTRKENNDQRWDHGTMCCGRGHPHAKLTEGDIDDIKQSCEPQKVIARRYGVDQALISRIKTGRRWALRRNPLASDGRKRQDECR